MCGFPHLDGIPSRWVGVIPLMGRKRVRAKNSLDSREAQGLIYMRSDETKPHINKARPDMTKDKEILTL
ncbi:hypothetical protein BFU36_12065 [Sulfolobus sp. A20]|nr:hypothetical protein BFU36_12065 [Sulfolobus sp. A20]TRM86582.1 hypothetical protein DJ529_10935 [Sulfolobus sp. C3]TRM86694.1 hypothetical protein DJ521_05030 [Sulfolobus sp. E3]TRM99026.1 hypothetical protein DJ527_09415 [Sulfolobus sp. F1]